MRVRLRGINRVTKRLADGRRVTYYYAWKGGPRLTGEPGSPEFHASYNAAAQSVRRPSKLDLQSLIDRYLQSPQFVNLKPKTKKTYRYHIKWIERDFGDLPISALNDRGIRTEFMDWRDKIGERSPRQADLAFRTLARIISWELHRDIAPANPCQRPGKLYSGDRRDKVWTPEQEAAFWRRLRSIFISLSCSRCGRVSGKETFWNYRGLGMTVRASA